MIKIVSKANCYGCSACSHSCPRNCITMIADQEGFVYPNIDEARCIDCGACSRVCPYNGGEMDELKAPYKVFAVKNMDTLIRNESASGGVFPALARDILDKDGYIAGAVYDEQFGVKHIVSNDYNDVLRMRDSKYVQSDVNSVFPEIFKLLKRDKYVLFTGTPCQNAGLKSYLKNDYDKLILCDIICHGVPSPLIFKNYIEYLEKNNHSKITYLSFRNKTNGWQNSATKIMFHNKKVLLNTFAARALLTIYYNHLATRPSCHTCKYAGIKRVTDVTIGDFWGIEKVMPDFVDKYGVSLVMLNTEKGQRFFENIPNLEIRESSIDQCLQPNLISPSKCHEENRHEFWEEYRRHDFSFILKKYCNVSLYTKLTDDIKYRIKKISRKI